MISTLLLISFIIKSVLKKKTLKLWDLFVSLEIHCFILKFFLPPQPINIRPLRLTEIRDIFFNLNKVEI